MGELLEALRGADHALFRLVNQVWTHPWLDAVMPALTDLHKPALVRFLLFPVGIAWWLYRRRREGAKVLAGLVLAVALADLTGHRVLKPAFRRPRPEKAGVEHVLRTRSHSGWSFPSNHAANSFAGASFAASLYPAARVPLLLFAAAVAYSRVYVGVHFPADAAGGALWGGIIGLLLARAWRRRGLGPRSGSGPASPRPRRPPPRARPR